MSKIGKAGIVAVAVATMLCFSSVQAEFLTLGTKSYVSEDGKFGVVLAKQGLFVLYAPSAQDAQGFSPLTKAEDAQSFFIQFGDSGQSADRFITAKGVSYSIKGSFRVDFPGGKSFALDTNSSGPYATLIAGESILALKGAVPIVNTQGDEAIVVLEANKQTAGNQATARSFSFDTAGRLLLGGKTYEGANVGIGREVDQDCQRSGIAIVPFDAVKALPVDEELRKKKIDQLLKKPKRLGDYVTLFEGRDSVVVFDPETNTFGILTTSDLPSVCAIKVVDFRKK